MEGKVFIASTNGFCEIIVGTSFSKVIRFREDEVRLTERKNQGVKAFRLEDGEAVTSITALNTEGSIEDSYIVIVDEHGNVKRVNKEKLPITCRAGKGVKI